jgi:hypothetical protein
MGSLSWETLFSDQVYDLLLTHLPYLDRIVADAVRLFLPQHIDQVFNVSISFRIGIEFYLFAVEVANITVEVVLVWCSRHENSRSENVTADILSPTT